MRLSQLFSIFPQLQFGESPTIEINGVTQDSRSVEKSFVFVAVRGLSSDGHDFIQTAIQQGAVAIVAEDLSMVPQKFLGAKVQVADSREALNRIASRFYGNPADQLFCVGVTGTNGKTSINYMVEAVLQEFGWKTGVLGTIDHHLDKHKWKTNLTTPDTVTLQRRLAEMVSLGGQAASFEVSSIALDQKRADFIPFNVAVFSNLSHDHLDYHGDFQNYFSAKEKLFVEVLGRSHKRNPVAIINIDDSYGQSLRIAEKAKVLTYGHAKSADISFDCLEESFAGSQVQLTTHRGSADFFFPFPGRHNIYNAAAAIGVGLSAGASLDTCIEALQKFAGVPGRMQSVKNQKGLNVYVDYAHTPDALSSTLKSLARIRKPNEDTKIHIVFGCGGDRDQEKRPLMTQAALEFADLVYLTSDNPRGEDPQKILQDCTKQVPLSVMNKKLFLQVDRRKAIELALQSADTGDCILIAGKGHEDYQIVNNKTIHFDDVEVAMEILN